MKRLRSFRPRAEPWDRSPVGTPRLRDRFLAPQLDDFPDTQNGDGVDRRLAQAAGIGRGWWGVRRSSRAGPVLRAGEVALRRDLRVEDDVGSLPGLPLVRKEDQ
jgi:hypothetical protein